MFPRKMKAHRQIVTVAGFAMLVGFSAGCRRGQPSNAGGPAAPPDAGRTLQESFAVPYPGPESIRERAEAVRQVAPQFSSADLNRIFEFLSTPPPAGTSREGWLLSANEVMEQLRKNPQVDHTEHVDFLLKLAETGKADPIIRDYAIQHALLSASQGQPPVGKAEPAVMADAVDRIVELIATPSAGDQETLLGTALLGLADLLENPSRPEELIPRLEAFDALLEPLISGTRVSAPANRVSAIQAAGRRREPKSLAAIRRIVTDPAQASSLRLSSISALGAYRDEADRAFLADLAGSQDRLRYAAIEALKKYPETP